MLTNVTSSQNGLHGLDVQTGSAATVMGTLTVNANQVFGINVNGSSFTLSEATVTASGNALGIQIATNANAFINDSSSVINATNNFSVGLTVVSGAHPSRSTTTQPEHDRGAVAGRLPGSNPSHRNQC